MKQYMIDNSKSTFFGITCYEIESYTFTFRKEKWIKVVFDYPMNGSFKEVKSWFRDWELVVV